MQSYDALLIGVISWLDSEGVSRETLDKLEDGLPSVWSAYLIADALDQIAAR